MHDLYQLDHIQILVQLGFSFLKQPVLEALVPLVPEAAKACLEQVLEYAKLLNRSKVLPVY